MGIRTNEFIVINPDETGQEVKWSMSGGTLTYSIGGSSVMTGTSSGLTIPTLNITTPSVGGTAVTSTAAELNKLDDSVISTTLVRGTGVDGSEGYAAGYYRFGSLIITQIYINIDDLVGSATDLDVIGESATANCNWGRITAAANGTIVAGTVQCLEVPAGGADDIDFYSSDVATGTQDVIITDAALGTETALVTSGGAWTAALTKVLTGFPAANDYIYVVNGAASGGTFTAGKFLMTLIGVAS